jgi:hypothetical protein
LKYRRKWIIINTLLVVMALTRWREKREGGELMGVIAKGYEAGGNLA